MAGDETNGRQRLILRLTGEAGTTSGATASKNLIKTSVDEYSGLWHLLYRLKAATSLRAECPVNPTLRWYGPTAHHLGGVLRHAALYVHTFQRTSHKGEQFYGVADSCMEGNVRPFYAGYFPTQTF